MTVFTVHVVRAHNYHSMIILFTEIVKPTVTGQLAAEGVTTATEMEDYQALSKREEEDLETLMSGCDAAISNAEVFAEKLSKQLSVLDGVRKIYIRRHVKLISFHVSFTNFKLSLYT